MYKPNTINSNTDNSNTDTINRINEILLNNESFPTWAEALNILGIPEELSPSKEDIIKAYKNLALLVHPDKNYDKSASANTAFKRLENAKSFALKQVIDKPSNKFTSNELKVLAEIEKIASIKSVETFQLALNILGIMNLSTSKKDITTAYEDKSNKINALQLYVHEKSKALITLYSAKELALKVIDVLEEVDRINASYLAMMGSDFQKALNLLGLRSTDDFKTLDSSILTWLAVVSKNDIKGAHKKKTDRINCVLSALPEIKKDDAKKTLEILNEAKKLALDVIRGLLGIWRIIFEQAPSLPTNMQQALGVLDLISRFKFDDKVKSYFLEPYKTLASKNDIEGAHKKKTDRINCTLSALPEITKDAPSKTLEILNEAKKLALEGIDILAEIKRINLASVLCKDNFQEAFEVLRIKTPLALEAQLRDKIEAVHKQKVAQIDHLSFSLPLLIILQSQAKEAISRLDTAKNYALEVNDNLAEIRRIYRTLPIDNLQQALEALGINNHLPISHEDIKNAYVQKTNKIEIMRLTNKITGELNTVNDYISRLTSVLSPRVALPINNFQDALEVLEVDNSSASEKKIETAYELKVNQINHLITILNSKIFNLKLPNEEKRKDQAAKALEILSQAKCYLLNTFKVKPQDMWLNNSQKDNESLPAKVKQVGIIRQIISSFVGCSLSIQTPQEIREKLERLNLGNSKVALENKRRLLDYVKMFFPEQYKQNEEIANQYTSKQLNETLLFLFNLPNSIAENSKQKVTETTQSANKGIFWGPQPQQSTAKPASEDNTPNLYYSYSSGELKIRYTSHEATNKVAMLIPDTCKGFIHYKDGSIIIRQSKHYKDNGVYGVNEKGEYRISFPSGEAANKCSMLFGLTKISHPWHKKPNVLYVPDRHVKQEAIETTKKFGQ